MRKCFYIFGYSQHKPIKNKMEILDPFAMDFISTIVGIVNFIALIVFFVMSMKIGNITKNVQSIQKMLEAQQEKE